MIENQHIYQNSSYGIFTIRNHERYEESFFHLLELGSQQRSATIAYI